MKGTPPKSVRLSDAQRAKLQAMAAVAGTDESTVIRRLIDSSTIVCGSVFVEAIDLAAAQHNSHQVDHA